MTPSMTFRLYTTPTGGTPIWSETQTVALVSAGQVKTFSVILGNTVSLASIQFNQQYYVGISVNGGAELMPRIQLAISPYAVRSHRADTAMAVAGGAIDATALADGSILTSKLANGAVTSQKIADGTIVDADVNAAAAISYSKLNLNNAIVNGDLTANSVTTSKVANGTVTTSKLADSAVTSLKLGTAAVNTTHIADGSIVDADVNASAAIAYSKLNLNNAIVNADITANAVTTSKIANGSITTSKMADSAISGLKLGTAAVNTAHIADGSIITVKLADGSILTAKIAEGSITTSKIADGAVTSVKIADSTITNADISATAAIAYSKLALTNSIVNGDLTANSVTTSKVANGTVTTSKMADSAISGLKLLTGAVTTAHITDGAVTLPKISASSATSGQSVTFNGTNVVWGTAVATPSGAAGGDLTGTYPNPTIAASSVTSAKIADSTITNADVSATAAIAYSKLSLTNSIANGDLTANSVTTSKVANGTVTTSKMADSAVSGLKLLTYAVTDRHIADQAVTLPKINTTGATSGQAVTYNGTNVVWGTAVATPSGAAGGDLTGTYPNPTIATSSVTSAKIADSTITNADVSATAAIAYSKLALTNSIANGDLTANSVTTSKVANGTVTTSKLADSAVSGLKLLTYAVTDRHIADGAVTLPKINTTGATSGQAVTYNGTNVVWGTAVATPSGAAGGDLTGTYPNPTIANSSVTSAKVLDGTLVNADISTSAAIAYSKLNLTNGIVAGDITSDAVTTLKIADGNVTRSKIQDTSISTSKLADASVTDAKVANGISYSKLSGAPTSLPPGGAAGGDLTGTYPNPTIAGSAVTSAKIADSTITSADISATAAIPYSKLSLTNSIQNGDITANAITTSKVANGTVTTSKLADSAVSGLKLLTYAVTDRHIADNAVTLPKINPTGATTGQVIGYNGTNVTWTTPSTGATGSAGGDLTGTYPNPTIANSSVTSAKVLDGTLVNSDISTSASISYSKLNLSNSVATSDLTNGSVTTSKLADSAVSGLKLGTAAVNTAHIADGAVTLPKINTTGATSGQVLSYNGSSAVWTTAAGTVTTNATLSGNGSSGSPLGVNLGNSNTWTANQTFGGTFLITANSRIAMTNSDNNARDIRFQEPSGTGSQYIGLRAPSVTNNGNYVFPAVVGSVGQVLSLATSNGVDSATMAWTTPSSGATGAAGGDLSGTYPNPTIATSAVTSAKIADSTITSADISATAAIPYSKLSLTNSIGNGDITANAITTSKVANGTVTTSKLADSAVSGLKLLTFAVTNRHLAANSVTTDKIDPTGATTGQVLGYNGSSVVWTTPSGGGTVTTNATLSGNGSSGSPLGVNLGNSNTWTANQTFGGTFLITANSRIAMTNSDNNARDIRFQEPSGTGSQYIGLRAPSVTNNGNYVLPAVMGSAGQVLTLSASNGIDSGSMAWTTVSGGGSPTGAAGGDLSGSYPNPVIAGSAVTSAKIQDGTITDADINSSAAIAYSKLSLTNSIVSGDLAANSVTLPKIDPTGATTGQVIGYNGTSVVWTTPGSGSLADSSVTDAKVAANAGIHVSKLNLTNGIQNTYLVANSVTTSKVANGTVTTSKLADSAVSGLKLLTFAVTSRHLATGAVTPDKISSSGATTGNVLKYNGSNVVWATPSSGGMSFSHTSIGGTTYSVPSTDDIVGCDVSSNGITVTLPAANSVPAGKVLIIRVENGDASVSGRAVTINRNGTDLINYSQTSLTINQGTAVPATAIRLFSDGTNQWWQW